MLLTLAHILGIVLTLLGAALLLHGLYLIALALRSRRWLQAPATISACEIIATRLGGTADSTSHQRANITYTYTVNRAAFTSTRYAFESQGILGTFQESQSRARRYLPGAKGTAHYHPRTPALAVLEPGLQRYTCDHAVLGLLILGLGVLVDLALLVF